MNTTTTEIQYPISKAFNVGGKYVLAKIPHKGAIVEFIVIAETQEQANAVTAYIHEEGMNTLQFLQQ